MPVKLVFDGDKLTFRPGQRRATLLVKIIIHQRRFFSKFSNLAKKFGNSYTLLPLQITVPQINRRFWHPPLLRLLAQQAHHLLPQSRAALLRVSLRPHVRPRGDGLPAEHHGVGQGGRAGAGQGEGQRGGEVGQDRGGLDLLDQGVQGLEYQDG